MLGGFLFTGSGDKSIRVWDARVFIINLEIRKYSKKSQYNGGKSWHLVLDRIKNQPEAIKNHLGPNLSRDRGPDSSHSAFEIQNDSRSFMISPNTAPPR